MASDMLDELRKLQQQLDRIIHTYELQVSPGDVATALATAAACHPNPAPARPLAATIATLIPGCGERRAARLLAAHGYTKIRTAAGVAYRRPNAPEPAAPAPPDPEPPQDQSAPCAPTPPPQQP